jgi:putative membrane protein
MHFFEPQVIGASLFYSLLGVAAFFAMTKILHLVLPFDFKKEIEHDQNVAVAIMVGAAFIGISIIIASAIHG